MYEFTDTRYGSYPWTNLVVGEVHAPEPPPKMKSEPLFTLLELYEFDHGSHLHGQTTLDDVASTSLRRQNTKLLRAIRNSENERALDDAWFSNNTHPSMFPTHVDLENYDNLVPDCPVTFVKRKSTDKKRARETYKHFETKEEMLDCAMDLPVAGLGDCWTKLLGGQTRKDAITLREFLAKIKMYKKVGLAKEYGWHSTYVTITWSPHSGDLHLESVDKVLWPNTPEHFWDYTADVWYRNKRGTASDPGYVEHTSDATLPPLAVKVDDLEDRFCLVDVLADAYHGVFPDRMIGYAHVSDRLKPAVDQMPNLFNLSLEPAIFGYSVEYFRKAAKWYWDNSNGHPLRRLPSPGFPDNGTHLPPSVPGLIPSPAAPVENFPHVLSPFEVLMLQLEALAIDACDAARLAYNSIIEKLQSWGIHLDSTMKFLILNFRHFAETIGEKTRHYAQYIFDHFGLEHVLQTVGDTASVVATFVTDAVCLAWNVADYGMIALKVLTFLLQDFTEFHGPDHVYRRAILSGELNFHADVTNRFEQCQIVRQDRFHTGLSKRLVNLNQQCHELSATNAAEIATVAALRDQVLVTITNVNTLRNMVLPETTPTEVVSEFQSSFPEYNVGTGVNPQPHPKLASIRSAFRSRANDHLGKRNRPVRAVGASNTEMPTIDRLVHNCWPTDSGRTKYRKDSHHSPANAFHRSLTGDHKFEDCPHNLPDGSDVYGSDVWSFFSAHDIPPEVFIREMANSASDTAVVALHLPFPLLDRRVRSYVDSTVGLLYEVEGDRLLVYHIGDSSGSAGYSHDFETVYSWMHNLVNFENAHVQLEVISQIGTAVLFALTVSEGKQEVVPSLWSCQREPFYILPELMSEDLRQGERPHFAVSARRFEQLVAYVSTLTVVERTMSSVVSKLRGMLAEIRVGVHTIETRWSVTVPQLYSLVQHAIIAHELHMATTLKATRRLTDYYTRTAWRNGSLFMRIVQSQLDILTFRAHGESDPLATPKTRWFFSNRMNHKHTYNPYQRVGEYRLVNIDVKFSNKLNRNLEPKRAANNLQWATKALSTSVWATVAWPARAWSEYVHNVNADRKQPVEHDEMPNRPEPEVEPEREDADLPEARNADTPNSGRRGQFPPPPPDVEPEPHGNQSFPETDPNEQGNYTRAGEPSGTKGKGKDPAFHPVTNEFLPPPTIELPTEVNWRKVKEPKPIKVVYSSGSDTEPVPDAEPVRPTPRENFVPDEDAFRVWLGAASKAGTVSHIPTHHCSPQSQRKVDFTAPLLPVNVQHRADDTFSKMMGTRNNFVWPKDPTVVPMPSNGACSILDAVVDDPTNQPFPETFLPGLKKNGGVTWNVRRIVNMFTKDMDSNETESTAALTNKFTSFAEHCVSTPGSLRAKVCAIDGPPMSAKSTLLRRYVTTRLKTALVYVPSRKLKKEWEKDSVFLQHATIMTRHSVPKTRGHHQVGIIDEVYNFSAAELYLHMRVLRAAGCQTIFLAGDRTQREATGLELDHAYLNHTLQLHTSLGMPRDAHALYCRKNRLDTTLFDTTSSIESSIFFTRDRVDFGFDLTFKMHGYAGSRDVDLTVGKVQGSRAVFASFEADVSLRQAEWLNDSLNRFSVAFTRHTKALVVYCSAATAFSFVDLPLQPYHVVGYKREDMEHTLHPNVVDYLVKPLTKGKLNDRESKLRAVLSAPLVMEGCAVNILPDDAVEIRKVAKGSDNRAEISNFCLEQSNFELVEPAELDLVTSQPRRPMTMRDPGLKVQRNDVRNDVEGSSKLADIQVNSSGYDSFKNLIDRQIATTKSSKFGTKDMQEGVKIYNRFRECYYSKEHVILDVETQASWLAETEVNALNMIANGEPLGETARSLTVDAEFKTQTKAKAIPGFAATMPYGQSILANSKMFNAYFADSQPKLYLNLQKLLRTGVIMDYGMSDQALSAKLRDIGVAHLLNGPKNIQADLSKQDSSHTAALLYAFVLIAKDCGLNDEQLNFYMAYTRKYHFRSRGADAVKSSVSFNLGSGDPFTLIRNNVMEMCIIACSYTHADKMVLVEKGDDVHGFLENLATHFLINLPSVRQTKLTVDYGVVGYHAGRFHNGNRYLVDPVRAFLKHFTRLSDSNVSNAVLYSSYVSRATDYDDEEVEFLLRACQMHYPFYSSSQVSVMIDTMLSLRDRHVFERYSKIRVKDHTVTVDTVSDCAVNCVRSLRPNRNPSYYRKFRGLRQDDLVELLKSEGIPYTLTDGTVFEEPLNTVIVSKTHAKVHLCLTSRSPTGTFKIEDRRKHFNFIVRQ